MKIAILSRYQNKSFRGAESVVYELSKRLSVSHEVTILSGPDSDSLKKMVTGGFDIVMPINGRTQALKASLGRIIGGYKLVIGGHSGIGRDDIFNIAVCKPDVFIALTDYMGAWAKKWSWGSKVIKITNGVDLKKFNPQGGRVDLGLQRPIILSVGALVWYKHHETAIKAVSNLETGSLLIIGSGPERQSLEELGSKLLGDRFMIKSVDYESMPDIYRSVDLFTLPSWSREAFGVVYLEAMATGLGVVAPNDLSRSEIIGQAGILVNVDDMQQYTKAILKALDKDWKEFSIKQAEKFSWEIVVEEYERCFSGLF